MLYKYFKIDEYSISNLIRDEFYCQNYKAFNDPFECWFIINEGIPNPLKEPERFEMICNAWGFHPNINDESIEDFNLYMEELECYQPDVKKYIEGARISCFSKEQNNLLMWSHYADGLRGFCIEYEEDLLLSIEKDKEVALIDVNYEKRVPVVDKMLYSLANDQIWYHEMALEEEPKSKFKRDYLKALKEANKLLENLYQKTIATKPLQWKYEKETRLIFYSENVSGEFYKYPPNAIKSVFFGERMRKKDIDTLLKILESKDIVVDKKIAHRNNCSYDILFKPI